MVVSVAGIFAAVTAVAAVTAGVLLHKKNAFGEDAEVLPETFKKSVSISQTDKEYIQLTRDALRKNFGDNVVESFKNASNFERIQMTQKFAVQLAELYGLDINVDVCVSNRKEFGVYSWGNQKAEFNVYLLTYDGNEKEDFKFCVRNTLLSIIHELRHAVQEKAIFEEGFWNVSEEIRIEWANSKLNYIRADVDLRGYATQSIEADAMVFSELAMQGII